MSDSILSALYDRYPEIIAVMPDSFTSHEFILKLAQKYQKEYVEALYAVREPAEGRAAAPFQNVHRALAEKLNTFSELVDQTNPAVPSKDIFGHNNACAEWHKMK
jgi:hypothetical protein